RARMPVRASRVATAAPAPPPASRPGCREARAAPTPRPSSGPARPARGPGTNPRPRDPSPRPARPARRRAPAPRRRPPTPRRRRPRSAAQHAFLVQPQHPARRVVLRLQRRVVVHPVGLRELLAGEEAVGVQRLDAAEPQPPALDEAIEVTRRMPRAALDHVPEAEVDAG